MQRVGEARALPSWNAGAAKDAVIAFVEACTRRGPGSVPLLDRIATGIAVYHLGNSGAARTQLKEWPLHAR